MFRERVRLSCRAGSVWESEYGQMWSHWGGPATPPDPSVCMNPGQPCRLGALLMAEKQQAERTGVRVQSKNPIDKGGRIKTISIHYLQLILKECKVVTANALNNLFLCLLYKLVISIHLNINWIKI